MLPGECAIHTTTNSSRGSTHQLVPLAPGQEKSPTEPIMRAMPGVVRTATPRIEIIVAVVVLWLLMIVAITELELVAVPDQWRLNLANNALAPCVAADDGCRI